MLLQLLLHFLWPYKAKMSLQQIAASINADLL